MNELPDIKKIETRKRCDCIPKCKEYFRIDGINVYCKKYMEKLAVHILREIDGCDLVSDSSKFVRNSNWSVKEELFLIEYFSKNEIENGIYTKVGLILGRERTQVKNKVHSLVVSGRLEKLYKRGEMKQRRNRTKKNRTSAVITSSTP